MRQRSGAPRAVALAVQSELRVAAATILTLAVLILPLACSAIQGPGHGDIAFRLRWTGTSDLDLHVEDPSGAHISFHFPSSPSGGVLDVDCNRGPETLCAEPIENVFWPRGAAPHGRYTYSVQMFRQERGQAVRFSLQVLLGTSPAVEHSAALSQNSLTFGPLEFTYPPPAAPAKRRPRG